MYVTEKILKGCVVLLVVSCFFLSVNLLVSGKGLDRPSKTAPTSMEQSDQGTPQSLRNAMENHWIETLNAHNLDINEWDILELKDVGQLSFEETNVFNKEVLSKTNRQHVNDRDMWQVILAKLDEYRQIGDSLPLFLIHPNGETVNIVFQRDYGQGEKVVIQMDRKMSVASDNAWEAAYYSK